MEDTAASTVARPSKICLKTLETWEMEETAASTVAGHGKICLKIQQTGDGT